MFSPKLLLAAHATEVFKAAASDPNATEDTKDPVRQADQNEDKLDKVENQLFSSQSLLNKNGLMKIWEAKKWNDRWQKMR